MTERYTLTGAVAKQLGLRGPRDNVRVSPDGIPYIHYLPQKTKEMQKDYCEIETPIVRFALDIIKRSGFNFPVLRNQTGRAGYNAKIKSLLQSCHIDRKVNIFNEKTQENEIGGQT